MRAPPLGARGRGEWQARGVAPAATPRQHPYHRVNFHPTGDIELSTPTT